MSVKIVHFANGYLNKLCFYINILSSSWRRTCGVTFYIMVYVQKSIVIYKSIIKYWKIYYISLPTK